MNNFKGFDISKLKDSPIAKLNPHLSEATGAKKEAKYKNKKVNIDGEEYDSIKEGKRRGVLKLLLRKGEILFLARQVEFIIRVNGEKLTSYYADFVYVEVKTRKLIVEDVKSEATRKLPAYRLKKKAMLLQHNINIQEI